MKKRLLAFLTAVLLPIAAFASPYFDYVGSKTMGYKTSIGMLTPFDADPTKAAQIETAIAFLGHKADPDNSLLPASWAHAGYAETWAVSGGFANSGGDHTFTLGPSLNVMQWMKAPLYNMLNRASPTGYSGLKAILDPADQTSGAAGPQFTLKVPVVDGALMPINKWKGGFQAWAGKSWSF